MQSNTIRRKMQSVKIFFLQLCNFAVDQGVSRKGKTGFARTRISLARRSPNARSARPAWRSEGAERGTRIERAGATRSTRASREAEGTHQACGRHGEARGTRSALSARQGRGGTRRESHASSADVTADNRHVEPKGNLHRRIMPVRCPLLYSRERGATFFRPKRRRFGR